MSYKNRIISFILLIAVMAFSTVFSAGAFFENETAVNKFYSDEQKLICISHRGDTVNYPENSLEGVKSALKKGADFVSVSLDKTSDGVFYLCERESLGNICNASYENLSQMNSSEADNYQLFDVFGKETEFKLTSLEALIKKTDAEDGIILDIRPEDKDAVYDVLYKNSALERMIIRVEDSASKLVKWAEGKPEKVNVICVYGGNIIFSTVNYINKLTKAEMPAVQYESKNYFNVAYGAFFANRYLTAEKARAVAAAYSPDLCGQRSDSYDGWNELIKKGYSVIETNNVEAFVAYKEEAEKLEGLIKELLDKAFYVDPAVYSQVSLDNLEKAKLYAACIGSEVGVFSLDEAQQAYSKLIFALEDMKISSGEVDTRGALNVTAGKVIAAVTVGLALFAGQIYVYKMRKKKMKV